MTRPRVTGYQFYVDEDTIAGDGTAWNPLRALGGASVAPSIAMSFAALPAAKNLSTEGVIDWLYNGGTLSQYNSLPNLSLQPAARGKLQGGWILNSWLMGNPGGGAGTYNSGVAITSNAADDTNGTALNVPVGDGGYVAHLGGYYRFRVPAALRQRTLKIITITTAAITTYTATLNNAARTTAVITQTAGAGISLQQELTVSFTADEPCDLSFSALITQSNGGTTALGLAAITLF